MFKCAFLGCGPRAKGHARVYKNIQRGRIVGISDLDEKRLQAFGDEFGVRNRYRDAAEMLDREKPDVLHLVTIPGLRVPLLTFAAAHKVPLVIVEKPIALWGEDYKQIKALGEQSQTKFVVNTQLHFHGRNLELKRDVADGRIGEVRHIDVSARSTPLDQGVHVLELAHSYNGFSAMAKVFGNVAGGKNLASRQPAPDMAQAYIDFANGVHASFITGACAPIATKNESIYHHKRIAAFGTRGFVQWTMWWWERLVDGKYERGEHDYGVEDDQAQARLTEAAGRMRQTGVGTLVVVDGAHRVQGLLTSRVALPFDPPDGLYGALSFRLT